MFENYFVFLHAFCVQERECTYAHVSTIGTKI